jgi:glutamate--cysteine ligase
LDQAWQVVADWTAEDRAALRADVPRLGLKAVVRGRTVQDLAKDILKIAHEGLARRNRLNAAGDNETGFLEPLHEIAASGITAADELLAAYHGRWNGDLTPVFREYGY